MGRLKHDIQSIVSGGGGEEVDPFLVAGFLDLYIDGHYFFGDSLRGTPRQSCCMWGGMDSLSTDLAVISNGSCRLVD